MSLYFFFAVLIGYAHLAWALIDKELYDRLGVQSSASQSEIKRSFKKLSREKHPDKNPGNEEAQQEFIKIQEAYEILKDPDLRNMYNLYGKAGVMDVDDDHHGHNHGGEDGGIFDNIFGGIFGGGGGGGQGQQRQQQRRRRQGGSSPANIKRNMPRTQDLRVRMQVSLNDMYNGAQKTFSYKRNILCSHCHGTGAEGGETTVCNKCKGTGRVVTIQEVMPGFRMQQEHACPKCHGRGQMFKHECNVCHGAGTHPQMTRITVDIEPGMRSGEVVTFERKAEEAPGHIPGDVHVQLEESPHNHFRREGWDLHTQVELSLRQALCGFDLSINHLDKHEVQLKHLDVTQHHRKRKYKKEGMPKRKSTGGFGNLWIEYLTTFPDEIFDEDKETLKKLFPSLSLEGFMPIIVS